MMATATLGALLAGALTGCGGSSGPTHSATPTPNDTATTAASPPGATQTPAAAALPADFPVGSWAKVKQQFHETLTFSDAAAVTLHDSRGQSLEHVTLPAAHQMTFDAGDKAFCLDAGTYGYAVTKHQLHFTLVGKDKCQSRVDYLTGSAWTFTG
jgi:hypothetical protein